MADVHYEASPLHSVAHLKLDPTCCKCRSFDPQMGTTGRVLWEAAPELLHLGAVICTAAVMVGIMGSTLFGFRAEAVSSLSCKLKWAS